MNYSASDLLAQFMSGVTRAGVVFILASGLTVIFGVLKIINFAHGSLYMLGGYIAYSVSMFLLGGNIEYRFWLGLLLVPLIMGSIGCILERFLIRRIYSREEIYQLIMTYALVLIFFDFVRIAWGTQYKSVARPNLLLGAVSLPGGRLYPQFELFMIVIAIAVFIFLWYLIYKTRLGNMVRAAASDRELASALGVNVPKLFTIVFGIGSALCGLGGTLGVCSTAIHADVGMEVIIECFIVVVCGGLGSIWGAALGAFILGQVSAFGILLFPMWALAFSFCVLVIVLIFRPYGIFGKP